MAAAPDDGSLRPPGPAPLGAILVQRGVLTPDQLAAALAEQKRSGGQLGEIIVRLGFALPPMIGQALATQHGGLLKTEYGYAVGFGGDPPTAPVDQPPLTALPEPDGRSPSPARTPALHMAPALEPALPPPPALSETQADPAGAGRPTSDPAALDRRDTEHLAAEPDAVLRDAEARAAELQRRLEEAATQLARLEAERNDALTLAHALNEEQREHHPDEHANDPSHLLFAPVTNGYLLFEQQGPPPAPGSTLEFRTGNSTTRLYVTKLGAAPLPGVRLACAYLIEAE
jgi:hypothetical protein